MNTKFMQYAQRRVKKRKLADFSASFSRFSLQVFQGVLTFLFSFDIISYRNGRSASDEDMYQRASLCTVSFLFLILLYSCFMESLSDKVISRKIEYLRNIGWTEKPISDFIEYIVRQ